METENSFTVIFKFSFIWERSVDVCTHTSVRVWKLEDSSEDLSLSFHLVGLRTKLTPSGLTH